MPYSLESAFHQYLDIVSEKERATFLNQLKGDSPHLHQELAELLNAHGHVDNFLESSPSLSENPEDLSDLASHIEEQQTAPISGTTPNTPTAKPTHLSDDFGDYILGEKIAQGGMGVIYQATQKSLGRTVAVKMILSGQLANQSEVDRFYIEAEAAGDLDHPGIVPVYEVGCIKGQHFFSMAFVDGKSLKDQINESPMPPRDAAMLVQKLANAIQFAHQRGIVHRDLKPGNVLISQEGEPRITDFGLAKRVESSSDLTKTGMVLGTPSFMPPEQASGQEANVAADVYSLGAILYATLSGQPPFDAANPLDTILQVLNDEPVSLRHHDRSIPKDLEAICLKCLEKNPVHRYATAQELSEDLHRFLLGEPILAKNDFRRRFRKWTIREPVFAAHLLATVVLMIIIYFNWLVFGKTERSNELLKINCVIAGIWTAAMFVFQKTQNILKSRRIAPLAWAVTTPIFVTVALAYNAEERGSLLSIYLLMMIISCFFRRVDIVLTTTFFSLLGFCYLVFNVLQESELLHPSHLMVFGINLLVSGSLLGLLTLRLNRLGEQATDSR